MLVHCGISVLYDRSLQDDDPLTMVVVSGNWIKNVATYPNSGDIITTVPKMAARAVLICRPNSHPFQERSLTLDQPVKIGRSVARARAAQNNAIFDCKVLSRNHALLWYENGKFYLQDTKSSNGTFVNNQRLSKGAEESLPREVCSGDIVQFGVDVMENARKDNMASAALNTSELDVSTGGTTVAAVPQVIFVTHGCIIATLKLYLPDGKEAKASSSTSVVSSIGMVPLEDLYQLNQYLQDALQREQILENKLATIQRLMETTRQASDRSWKALIDEDRLLSRVEILENQLQTYSKSFGEDKLREELRKLQEDKTQYLGTAKESLRKILQEKLDAITKLADLERTLSNTEDEVAHLKDLRERSQQELQELAQKYTAQLQKVEDLTSKLQEIEEQHHETCERLEQEKRELSSQLDDQMNSEVALQARLDAVTKDSDSLLAQRQRAFIQSCINSHSILDMKDGTETMKETDSTGTQVDLILGKIVPDRLLQDRLKEMAENLKYQLQKAQDAIKESDLEVDQLYVKLEDARSQEDSYLDDIHQMEENLTTLRKQMDKAQLDNSQMAPQVTSNQSNKLKAEIIKLEELLSENRSKAQTAEEQVLIYQKELDIAQLKVKNITEEVSRLQQQQQVYQLMMENKSDCVWKMHETIKRLTICKEELQSEVQRLHDKLEDEESASRLHSEEAERLRKQLVELQQSVKQGHNEAEKMKDRIKALQAELDGRISLVGQGPDNRDQEEVQQLKRQCRFLQGENDRLRSELVRIEDQYNKLLTVEGELEALKSRLAKKSNGGLTEELEESKLEKDQMTEKLNYLEEELVLVKEKYAKCNDERTRLLKDLDDLRHESGSLLNHTYAVPVHYLIPVALAMVAILVVIHQLV